MVKALNQTVEQLVRWRFLGLFRAATRLGALTELKTQASGAWPHEVEPACSNQEARHWGPASPILFAGDGQSEPLGGFH